MEERSKLIKLTLPEVLRASPISPTHIRYATNARNELIVVPIMQELYSAYLLSVLRLPEYEYHSVLLSRFRRRTLRGKRDERL